MFGLEILEVAIGIVFVFLLMSIIASAVREVLESKLKTRAAYLERGIRELLHDIGGNGLARQVYEHPLIYSLYQNGYTPGSAGKPALMARGRNLPSYIPAGNFAVALIDLAARGPDPNKNSDARAPLLDLKSVRNNIANLQNERVQRVLLSIVDSAEGDLGRAQKSLEAWFDSGMDRVSGWYKRSTQWVVFWIGLGVAIILNVNTVTIADYLYRDDAARRTIVARASAATSDMSYDQARVELGALQLPIGWWKVRPGTGPEETTSSASATRPARRTYHFDAKTRNFLLWSIPGWLVTALATTFGAPFWFDLLNKLMVIRSTVKPKEKSPDEPSADRPRGAPITPPPDLGAKTAFAVPLPVPAQGQAAPAPPPVPQPAAQALPDGCGVGLGVITRDEDLPAAEGGVA